jgi:hypothetical protein
MNSWHGNDMTKHGRSSPDLEATFCGDRWLKRARFHRDIHIIYQMKIHSEFILDTHSTKGSWHDEGDCICPMRSVIKEFDCEGADATKGRISHDEYI